MNNPLRFARVSIVANLLLVALGGCGSSGIGRVTGTVKGDGQPISGALLEFYPLDGSESSAARTASDGTYELIMNRSTKGAVIGQHLVKITTAQEPGDYGAEMIPETLPAKYNVRSDLHVTVNSGKNVLDFDLDYDGEVIQPRSGGY